MHHIYITNPKYILEYSLYKNLIDDANKKGIKLESAADYDPGKDNFVLNFG